MPKILLVTGGARGIGAATSRLAAEHGYFVCINYRQSSAAANQLVHEIEGAGGRAVSICADISSESEIVRMFEQVDNIGPLDSIVNNAGIVEQQIRLESIDAARVQRMFATNVTGAFLCSREAIRRMSTRNGGNGGAIVNVSSMAALLGSPGEYIDYAASKAAIDALTVGLAKEVATEGIRVNAVRPGLIHTDIHASGGEPDRIDHLKDSIPMKRGGEATEVAHAILWLLSAEASYCTGTFINVSGGR
jgi:NAD(P)-dependent dehydrogenase (short-subunit alcohol dehydrogenase family)